MEVHFSASEVPTGDLDEEYRCQEISVIIYRRKGTVGNESENGTVGNET